MAIVLFFCRHARLHFAFGMWLLLLMVLPEHIRNRPSVKVAAALVVVGTLIFWWYNFPFQKVHRYLLESHKRKSILLWNADPNRNEPSIKQNCGFIRCEIITNRSERSFESYDAVVILFGDKYSPLDSTQLVEYQRASNNTNQRLVFFTQASPLAFNSMYNVTEWADMFNWTMTYRRDSDIPLLYGRISPEESALLSPEEVLHHIERVRQTSWPRTFRMSPKKRTGKNAVAWTASDCITASGREVYVEELSKYIGIDIYGKCGNLTCAMEDCYDLASYKFYLSFENALCPDYVTDEFFKIMNHDIVPIVYGGANYSQHAPVHSYIDARQFKPKDLATYLKLLDANDTLYDEYFWWKDHYRVESNVEDMSANAFCQLCHELHRALNLKSYPALIPDSGDNNQCARFDPTWVNWN